MKQPSVEIATAQIAEYRKQTGCSLSEAVKHLSRQNMVKNLEEAESWEDVRDVLHAILRSGWL